MIIHIVALVGQDEHEAIVAYADRDAAEAKSHELQQLILNCEGRWANRKDWENYDPSASYVERYTVYELDLVEGVE